MKDDNYQSPATDTAPDAQNRTGWFRAMRTPDALELIKANPLAYVLAAIIAHRGRYSPTFNQHNLALGEALLGDYRNYGMSQKEYRTAKAQLAKWKFAAFKGANKGTVAKLIDSRLFSIFRTEKGEQEGKQGANEGRTKGEQRATNEERKNSKSIERAKRLIESPFRSSAETNPERADWGSLTTREKMLKVLGNAELTKRPDWLTRLEKHPNRIEEIMDAIHSDLATGRVIKNRGAYAESLWKLIPNK